VTAVLLTLATLAQDGGPDIIPDPDGEARPSNIGGLVVVAVLLLGWLAGGYLLLRRSRRRP
jgi:hypothetical protein